MRRIYFPYYTKFNMLYIYIDFVKLVIQKFTLYSQYKQWALPSLRGISIGEIALFEAQDC